jgi:hypothetical protein
VRRNFEVNVFAPLDFTQRIVKKWVSKHDVLSNAA